MNSDPYDSAAWRTFGMLNADESSTFNEAMREDPALRKVSLEMDRLAAAIAASAAIPAAPAAGLLEEIQSRVKLNPAGRRRHWLAISGWAAALVMALILIFVPSEKTKQTTVSPPPLASDSTNTPASGDTQSSLKAVTERLTQEITELRENLEKYQHRDRALFTASPGMALPIVMTMTPPGMTAADFQITTLLGDALRAATVIPEEYPEEEADQIPEAQTIPPSAMPIYDSARDFGTLVINNLPDTPEGEIYNLWVTTHTGGEPVYVGSLPPSSAAGADSFDFRLGSTMVLPSGFMLTKDPVDQPTAPTAANIVLQGPSSPAR